MVKLNTWITHFLRKYEVSFDCRSCPTDDLGSSLSYPILLRPLSLPGRGFLSTYIIWQVSHSAGKSSWYLFFFFFFFLLFDFLCPSFPLLPPFLHLFPSPFLAHWPSDYLPYFLLSSDALSFIFTALNLPTTLYCLQLQAHSALLNRLN